MAETRKIQGCFDPRSDRRDVLGVFAEMTSSEKVPTVFNRFGFYLYKRLILPFRRTPTSWSAIIFYKEGQFLVEHDGQGGYALPSGYITPGYSIPALCRRGLGLDDSNFTAAAPLRLIGVAGTGRNEITFYFSGETTCDPRLTDRWRRNGSLASISELGSFIPPEVQNGLKPR